MSKTISRIPIYMSRSEQYYDTMQLYARGVNNQMNNIILTLNRCHERQNRLKERAVVENIIQEKMSPCKNCEEKDKKGV